LDPQTGTTSWEVFVEHSTGYPRIGQLIVADRDTGALSYSHEFTGLAQGNWSVSGNATISGQTDRSTLSSINCTVAATPSSAPSVVLASDAGGL